MLYFSLKFENLGALIVLSHGSAASCLEFPPAFLDRRKVSCRAVGLRMSGLIYGTHSFRISVTQFTEKKRPRRPPLVRCSRFLVPYTASATSLRRRRLISGSSPCSHEIRSWLATKIEL